MIGKSDNNQLFGIVLVLLGALAIGIMPSAAKIAYQEGANPLGAILLRSLIGVLGIGVYILLRKDSFNIGWPAFRFSSFTGVMQSLNSIGIMGSVAFIDVSLAVLVIFCFPFWVIIYNHFWGQTRMTSIVALCFVAAIAGLGLALGVKIDSIDGTGLWLAVMGMFSMAAMVITVSRASENIGPIPANFFMTGWTSIYFLVIVWLAPELGWMDAASYPESTKGWLAILATGISFTLGYVLFFLGAVIIGSTRASMLSISEPILIILVAIFLVDEWLSPVQWLGLMLVIASLLVIELPSIRVRPKVS
ncbi:MAG: drug/metabolite transporter (DMT)-like permease [Parasphingorhabdus sp.]|jgi:drug/metabolite transporter (DMT)-like permease